MRSRETTWNLGTVHASIYPFSRPAQSILSHGETGAYPSCHGVAGYTLDGLPVYCRANTETNRPSSYVLDQNNHFLTLILPSNPHYIRNFGSSWPCCYFSGVVNPNANMETEWIYWEQAEAKSSGTSLVVVFVKWRLCWFGITLFGDQRRGRWQYVGSDNTKRGTWNKCG